MTLELSAFLQHVASQVLAGTLSKTTPKVVEIGEGIGSIGSSFLDGLFEQLVFERNLDEILKRYQLLKAAKEKEIQLVKSGNKAIVEVRLPNDTITKLAKDARRWPEYEKLLK